MVKLSKAKKVISINQIIAHFRLPLYRNGYILILNAIATSGLGVVYWVLAARLYSSETVGLNSAIISTMMLVSGVSMLGLNSALVRFMPVAGRYMHKLALLSYLSSVLVATSICFSIKYFIVFVIPDLSYLVSNWKLFLGFLFSTIVWCIFSLQDSIMIGLRKTVWLPIENGIFSFMKVGLLVYFVSFNSEYGIFISWVLPVLLLLLPVNILIFRKFIPEHTALVKTNNDGLLPVQVIRFVAGNYLGILFSLAYTTFMPIIVALQVGVTKNAYFYIPWTFTSALQLISVNMSTSLTVESVIDREKMVSYGRRVLMQNLRLLVPAVICILVAAPYILDIFGNNYSQEGSTLFRLLAISSIPNAIITLYIGLARVQNKVIEVTIVQAIICISTFVISYALLSLLGIIGVGWACLLSQSGVAGILLCTRLRPLLRKT